MPLLEPEYIDERSVRDLLRASPTPSGSTNETGSENPEPELDMESDDDSRPPSPTPIPASVRFPGKFPKPPMRAPRAEEDYMSEASYYSDRDGSVSGSQGRALRRASFAEMQPFWEPMYVEVTRFRSVKTRGRHSVSFETKYMSPDAILDRPSGALPVSEGEGGMLVRWAPVIAGRTVAFVAGGVATWLIVGAITV